jgi:hypothetical protein
VNLLAWPASILIVLTGLTCAVRAQEALVLDTYTCGQFLADVGDRGDSAKLRRSLMMIAWAAGYAAAREKDAIGSFEMIAATLGDVCRNAPAEKAAKAITDKINEAANRDASSLPSPPASPVPPAGGVSGRSFTAYSSRDMDGGDYHKQRGISLDQCGDLCKRNDRCQAYSYDAWNRYCFLKSSLNPLRLEPRSVTFVANGASVSQDEREPIIQRRTQKAFPNDPYLQANAASYGDCAQRCLKDKRCEAFNFYQSARRCNLIEKPKEYSDDRGADVGIKVQGAK